MRTIGFVGAGNMARALAGGLRAGGGDFSILATDPDPAARERFEAESGGRAVAAAADVLAGSDVIVLAVKPQVLPAVVGKIAGQLAPEQLVISIAAGFTLRALAGSLGSGSRLVRAMPNTPAMVREGVSVLVGGGAASADDLAVARTVFAGVGDVVVVDDEGLLDAVTAVSGSGPGFVFAFAEAWLQAAQAVGLAPELAERLVKQTLFGSATLWRRGSEPIDRLRAMVTSPGGTTLAGLDVLEARGFAAALRAAIEAATRRSRELSAG